MLDAFRKEVEESRAVIATNWQRANGLLRDESEAYVSFYRLVESGARSPRSNWFDDVRGIADSLLFPHYRDLISFAALTLHGTGIWYYGPAHLVLKDIAIRDRATVFQENSLLFCLKNELSLHQEVPEGYRAAWHWRDGLAACKLERRLEPLMEPSEFAGLLLGDPDSSDSDFVEVHIYDRLNRGSMDNVYVKDPLISPTESKEENDDWLMMRLVMQACRRANILCEVVS